MDKRRFLRSAVYGFLTFVFLAHSTMPVAAEEIGIEAEVSSTKVALGSSITLKVTVTGTQNVNPPDIPDIEGFDVRYLGPSRQVSIVNGNYSSSIAFTYSLLPLKTGTYTIPDMTLNFTGKSYRTEPIAIEVVGSGSNVTQQTSAPSLSLQDKIFLELRVPKKDVYLNEPLPVKIFLFVNNLSVRDIQFPPKMEQLGFTVDDFPQPRQYQQVISGVRYDIVEFDTVLYPTRTGEVTVGPAEVTCNILVRPSGGTSSGPRSLFDDSFFNSFFDRYEKRPVTLRSKTVTLNVRDLPEEGRPQDFTGAVGKFDFRVNVSPTKIKVGDPITLKMSISGEGNLSSVQFPTMIDNNDFKTYEPIIKEEGEAKTLEQVLIPKLEKIEQVPEFTFSYFNPDIDQYMRETQGPFPIEVAQLEQGEGLKVIGLDGQENITQPETLGRDIVFIKNNPGNFRVKGTPFYQKFWYYLMLVLFGLAWTAAYVYYLHSRRVATDVVYARRFMAPRQARKDLSHARKLLEAGKKENFYDQIFKTLQGYLANKFHLPVGAVTMERMEKVLGSRTNTKQVLEQLRLTFEECDMIRYASARIDEQRMNESFQRTEEIIDFMERQIK